MFEVSSIGNEGLGPFTQKYPHAHEKDYFLSYSMEQYTLLKRKLIKLNYYKYRSKYSSKGHNEDELVFYWKCRQCEFGVTTNCRDCLFDAFLWACANGKLPILKTMYQAGYEDVHQENDNALFWACRKGYLNIVKWLYSKYDYNFMTLVLCRRASRKEKQTEVWNFLNELCCKLYKEKGNKELLMSGFI